MYFKIPSKGASNLFHPEFEDICVLTVRGNSISLINLPMFFILPPSVFIHRTTSVVKGPLSVPLTLNEIPCVLIALRIQGSIRWPRDPDVCASSMLPGEENKNRNRIKKATVLEFVQYGYVGVSGVLSYLDSILPHPNILLSQFQPPHRALSMSQVVLPLTRVHVTRGVAVKTQMSPWGSSNATHATY